MINLRAHQQDCLNAITDKIQENPDNAVGRTVLPTGAGKTFIEAALVEWQRTENSKCRIHLVLAPRILLANQLIDEFRKFTAPNVPYRVIAFHSGSYEPDDEKIVWKEENTTMAYRVYEAHKNAVKNNQDLVVFSTYHSCDKLENIEFDTVIGDESQYAVAENFNNAVKKLKGRVRMFFTATERFTESNNGRGLNNVSVFGERLYYISPAELIRLGLIVAPRLHIMWAKTRSEEDSIISEIIELANEQDKLTRPDLGFSKILFAMKGTDDVKTIEDNIARIQKSLPLHDIFTITSKTGANINGEPIRREDFLAELKHRKNCLIFHYDILSEGIDVDGITGVALMRNLGLAKLLQTIGRAVRVYKDAPEAKKQAWISVPVLNGDEDDMARVKRYVMAIRDGGHDISAESVVETGQERHTPDEMNLDDAYGAGKSNFANLFIEEVFHEIENEEFWEKIEDATATVDSMMDLLFEEVEDATPV